VDTRRPVRGSVWACYVGAVAILAALGNLPAVAAEAVPPPGLRGHWAFDEGQGDLASDSSGNGNDGSLYGVQWVRGTFGTALRFTGTDSYVVVPPLDGLDGASELTVETWVLWQDGGRYPNLITGGQWSPGGFLLFVVDKACAFRLGRPDVRAGDPGTPWDEAWAPLVGGFETGRWYHLAATFKRPAIVTYVDGKLVGTATWDYPIGYRGDLMIGCWHPPLGCHNGLIDEVKVYNRALAAAEIAASFSAESPRRTAPGPVAYEPIPPTAPAGGVNMATLENPLAKLEIDGRGRCTALIDKGNGRNLLTMALPLVTLARKGKTVNPGTCAYADGKLSFGFGKGKETLVVGVTAKERYFTFEVLAVEGDGVQAVTFLALPLAKGKYSFATSGATVGDDWAVCLRELNLQTEVSLGGGPATARASAQAEYGLVGAKAALVVAPPAQLRPALQDMVKAEGVPQSPLGGPWALDAEGNRGSYLFAHPSEKEAERWIEFGKRGGFACMHYDGWYATLGHYEPAPAQFPNGVAGVKEMVRKVHAAGMKAGMHTLTGCIQPNDSWVTPVPDKRLAADASYTLAAALDEKADTIVTLEKPQAHDIIWSYSGGGNALRLGEEIIQYAAISYTPPYGFLKCSRGAFGTKPGTHAKGIPVDHLRQVYIAFYPDERTTLVGELADAIARVYNECEFDQIYMDGSEGMGSRHAVQTMRNAIYTRLQRPTIVEASEWGHWSWYYHSRIGAWDHATWGWKRFVDMHCADIAGYRQGALLQAQLGWWVVLGAGPGNRAETPDEMEYFCSKNLGYDAPSSTQVPGSLATPANARLLEYITMAGWYERLRLANYFPEAVRAQLREPGRDVHLEQADSGEWQLLPTDYLAHKVTGPDDGSDGWTVTNRFAAQPVRLRLEALYGVQPYDSPGASVLADPAQPEAFSVTRDASDVTHTLTRSTAQVKIGDASLCFSATSKRAAGKGAWAHAGRTFAAPYLDVGQGEALGLWIHGDGKGEVLNLQLVTPREYMHAYAEHYVKIDFTGWRYVALPLRERDADKYHDYEWPYFSQHGIFRTHLDPHHVSEVNLYLNNLPPNDTATVYLSPLRVLRTSRIELANPTVELNGEALRLPTTLRSGDYVELHAQDDGRVYDERGVLRERLRFDRNLPLVKAGENRLRFVGEALPSGFNARAELTLIVAGAALPGRTPDAQVNWTWLRDEYELPRVLTAAGGAERQWERWDVICRPNATAVTLGLEIEIEQAGTTDTAYNRPTALTLEGFDDLSFFADSPDNQFAQFVYDAQHKSLATKPGVTQQLERSTEPVKVGAASARYTATSTLADNSGWSARGRRYLKPLDLSPYQGIGFWLYGDGKGEVFKLQLRDQAAGWFDMVTVVDFTGWRYVQFDLVGADQINLAAVEYLLIYYNAIPAKQTVSCCLDAVRALPAVEGLRDPELTLGEQRLAFPAALSVGDRLVYDGAGTARLYRRGKTAPEAIPPQGPPPTLKPGRNPAAFAFGAGTPPQYRATVALVKHYK
jgi:hypothetical protein